MNGSSGTARARVLTIVGCALALAACERAPDASAPTPTRGRHKTVAPAEAPADPAVVEAKRTMAAGVPVGTTTAPVEVRFDVPTAPIAGQPFEVRVAVLPQALAAVLHIEVDANEGLVIAEPDGALTREKVEAGTLERITVKASSATPGTRILTVKVTLELPTGAESRAFAFPLIVAAPAAAPAKAPVKGAS